MISDIALALQTLEWLATAIPKWIAAAKAKGELTAEQEVEYQARQAAVFSTPYAQPEAAEPQQGPVSPS
jgi:hypothetical protein